MGLTDRIRECGDRIGKNLKVTPGGRYFLPGKRLKVFSKSKVDDLDKTFAESSDLPQSFAKMARMKWEKRERRKRRGTMV